MIGTATAATAADFITVAERTNYDSTSTYEETVDFVQRLEKASPYAKLNVFGQSGQRRDLHCLIVSKDRAFTPAAAKESGKIVMLIQNGIHAGEIDGKDACLALLRGILISKERAHLLDSVILLVIPIFNVDGHENTVRYTRPNQDGPVNAGFRATAQLYNLNRDYMKADSPEMRAWLRLWQEWMPDFFVDDHVTDGGDWQYTVHYTMPWHLNAAPTIREWTRTYFDPDVNAQVERAGFKIFPYAFPRASDPAKGVSTFVDIPRFSTGYVALWNRPGLLVETHMLKDYRSRVLGNHALLVAVLENLNRNRASLKHAIAAADSATVAGLRDPYPLTFEEDGDSTLVDFAGYEYDSVKSEATGGYHIVYDRSRPITKRVPYFGTFKAKTAVIPPRAYLIPRQWHLPIERLRLHGVRVDTLRAAFTAKAQMCLLDSAVWAKTPFEDHVGVTFRTNVHDTVVSFPAGTFVIDLHQPAAKVAIQALEPQGPDAFVSWGMWNAIFERKEYIEDYVIDPLADTILATDPMLREEFEKRLAADTAFAKSPSARRAFFYERSRYSETQVGWYPAVRLMDSFPPVDPWDGQW